MPDCEGWSGAECPGARRRWTGCGWATACPSPSSCGPTSFTGTFKKLSNNKSFHSLQFSDRRSQKISTAAANQLLRSPIFPGSPSAHFASWLVFSCWWRAHLKKPSRRAGSADVDLSPWAREPQCGRGQAIQWEAVVQPRRARLGWGARTRSFARKLLFHALLVSVCVKY